MFKILERYIARTMVVTTSMTAIVLMSVVFIMSFLGELKDMGQGDYGFIQAVVYVLMRLPNDFYQYASILILLGSIIGLNVLSSHRELTVMRAAGFSTYQIIRSVLMAAFAMVLLISFLGEFVGPHFSAKAEIRKENAQNAGQAVITSAGVWFHVDNNFIHVDHILDRQKLQGVTRYQFDDQHRLLASYYAKSMVNQGKGWVMQDVVMTRFSDNRTQSSAVSNMPLNLVLNTNLFNKGLLDANEMSLPRLFKFAAYLERNGLQASEYRFGFWSRLLMPLSTLVMIFLAIPVVLSGMGSSQLGSRVLLGIVVGFSFFILNALLGQFCIVFQVPPLTAALLPLLLFVSLGVYLTRRLLAHI